MFKKHGSFPGAACPDILQPREFGRRAVSASGTAASSCGSSKTQLESQVAQNNEPLYHKEARNSLKVAPELSRQTLDKGSFQAGPLF